MSANHSHRLIEKHSMCSFGFMYGRVDLSSDIQFLFGLGKTAQARGSVLPKNHSSPSRNRWSPKTIAKSLKVKRENAGFFNPMLDLASARHELAFSRLFIS